MCIVLDSTSHKLMSIFSGVIGVLAFEPVFGRSHTIFLRNQLADASVTQKLILDCITFWPTLLSILAPRNQKAILPHERFLVR